MSEDRVRARVLRGPAAITVAATAALLGIPSGIAHASVLTTDDVASRIAAGNHATHAATAGLVLFRRGRDRPRIFGMRPDGSHIHRITRFRPEHGAGATDLRAL